MSQEDIKARWPGCARCNHPAPLHSKGPCMAQGCHAGADGGPCPGFVPPVTSPGPPETPMSHAQEASAAAADEAAAGEAAADEEFADALMAAIAARRMAVLAAGAVAVVAVAVAVTIVLARRRSRG